jgi:hypothetical protein
MNRRELFPTLGAADSAFEASEYKPQLLAEREYAMVKSLTNITMSSCTSERLADGSNRGELKLI